MSAARNSDSRRRWSLALAILWACLGVWTLADGAERWWLGVAQLALAASFAVSYVRAGRTSARAAGDPDDAIAP